MSDIATAIASLLMGDSTVINGITFSSTELQKLSNIKWNDFLSLLEGNVSVNSVGLSVEDAITIAGDFGFVGAPIAILAVKLLLLAIEDGTQANYGSLTHLPSGKRGSDPQME